MNKQQMPPQQYPQSIGTCVILRNASHQTTEEEKKYWRWPVIHETGYLSQSQGYLPHPFNTANHQINVHRCSLPPRNTNYLSILYCQVLHALFMQATISETVNKKDGGVTLDGRELPGSERWSLMKLDCIRSKSKPEAQWWARICDSPSSKLGIFHGTTIWDVLFLWVSQVKSVRGAKVLCSMASISQKCNSGGSLYHFCTHN